MSLQDLFICCYSMLGVVGLLGGRRCPCYPYKSLVVQGLANLGIGLSGWTYTAYTLARFRGLEDIGFRVQFQASSPGVLSFCLEVFVARRPWSVKVHVGLEG